MTKAQDIKQYLKLLETIKNQRKEGKTEMGIPITKGKIETAKKVVQYGPEGIGKSTLASCYPAPVFIDTEGSTKELDVSRYPTPGTWNDIITYVNDFIESMPGKTLVIDTADWAEQLCIAQVCIDQGVKGIESVGYGKGYVYLAEKFQELLRKCDDLIEQGVNVVKQVVVIKKEYPEVWDLVVGAIGGVIGAFAGTKAALPDDPDEERESIDFNNLEGA